MILDDLDKAENYLNSLATENQRELDFITLQRVNLKWYIDNEYLGTAKELGDLENIALKVQEFSGLARTVYFRLTGERISNDRLIPRERVSEDEESSQYGESEDLALYPNPVTSMVNMEFDGSGGTYELRIYDVIGQEIVMEQFSGRFEKAFDLSNHNEGLYLVKITDADSNEEIVMRKFIKVK